MLIFCRLGVVRDSGLFDLLNILVFWRFHQGDEVLEQKRCLRQVVAITFFSHLFEPVFNGLLG